MTITSAFALYTTMVVLALLPGPGVIVVVARSLDSGFRQGLATAMGVLSGDFVFISLAVFGLAALAEVMGSFFVVIKYLGAAYLIYLGFSLIISKPSTSEAGKETTKPANHSASFLVGLITSIGNPKVILVLLQLLPRLSRSRESVYYRRQPFIYHRNIVGRRGHGRLCLCCCKN